MHEFLQIENRPDVLVLLSIRREEHLEPIYLLQRLVLSHSVCHAEEAVELQSDVIQLQSLLVNIDLSLPDVANEIDNAGALFSSNVSSFERYQLLHTGFNKRIYVCEKQFYGVLELWIVMLNQSGVRNYPTFSGT